MKDKTQKGPVRLVLLGTVHRDPGGRARLSGLLPKLNPKVISVEMSPLALMFRRKHVRDLLGALHLNLRRMASTYDTTLRQLLENGCIEGIVRQIELPYEYTASSDFAKESRIPVVCVDDSVTSRPKLSLFDELVSINNLEALPLIDFPSHLEQVQREYGKAIEAFNRTDAVPVEFLAFCRTGKEEWERRTRIMARKIRRLYTGLTDRGGGVLLHVGGWLHVGGRGRWPNLAAQLMDFSPRVLLLGLESTA